MADNATDQLKPGLAYKKHLRVTPELTVPQVSNAFDNFADMPPVFATALMVGLIESACIDLLRPHLQQGQKTVGTHINVSHVAATPVGMMVTAEVSLVAIEGRKLTFKVTCRDERDLIGEGTHERALIDESRFLSKLADKSKSG